MKVWKKLKQDQSGSTLILVLVCMAFVAVLGTTMLSVTLLNYQMKLVDSKEKDTFYTAETAMDEFCTGLEELANNALEGAYEYMLSTYSMTAAPERTEKFASKFADILYQDLSDESGKFVYGTNITRFVSGLQAGASVSLYAVPDVERYKDDNHVILKNVVLVYTDPSGYETRISTDIKLGVDFPTVSTNKTLGRGIFYADYAIIADQYIKNKSESGTHTIVGNVYAGAGVVLNEGVQISDVEKMTIEADYFISRGDITVNNKASFSLKGMTENQRSSLWVNSIVTGGNAFAYNYPANIYINADCYVADDLTLNAKNGKVTIEGNYYGYQSSETVETKSSAINVNASGCVLDLTGVNTLWVAGKTFLSVPSIYGSSSESVSYKEVAQGESISYKGFQNAYLLPGECIVGIGHNPITEEEYKKLSEQPTSAYIQLLNSYYNDGINLNDYVVAGDPYKLVAVQYAGAPTMYYLYLNFLDSDKASDYFSKYCSVYGARIQNQSQMFKDGRILINGAGEFVTNAGNIISYTDSGVSVQERNSSVYDAKISEKEMEYFSKYSNLINGLDETYSYGNTESMATNLIRYDLIPEIGIDIKEDNTIIYVSKSEDSFATGTTETSGIIITAGDVIVEGSFSGLIITKGNIYFSIGGSISAAEEKVAELINTYRLTSTLELKDLFYDYVSSGEVEVESGETIKASIVIEYENWKKN